LESRANQVLIIEAGKTERQYWRDLWDYRELFFFLAWRDILVRYKQTAIGVAWSVIRPVLTMIVFTVIFGHFAKMPSNGVPYPVLVFAGLLPWQYFSSALSESSASVVVNVSMVSKVYFPRLVVPASALLSGLVDFAITIGILIVLMVAYRFPPHITILLLPVFTLMAVAATAGPGLWFAALNVKFRDFRYIIPFVIQFGIFVSPVGISSRVVPPKWEVLYSLNPMVSVIDGFRYAILGPSAAIHWRSFAISSAMIVALLVCGVTYFRKTERTFADLI
jgi:lipopolysaccharide transport system permease protein